MATDRDFSALQPQDAASVPTEQTDGPVLAIPDWRLRAMDEPDFSFAFGLESIRRQVAHWIEYDKAGRDAEGLETTPDTHITSPPVWPSHGQLAAWVALFERIEGRLKASETGGLTLAGYAKGVNPNTPGEA